VIDPAGRAVDDAATAQQRAALRVARDWASTPAVSR
jgi:hypothetical protein